MFQVEKLRRGVYGAFRLHLEVLGGVLKVLEEIRDEGGVWLCGPLRRVIRVTKRLFLAAAREDKGSGAG